MDDKCCKPARDYQVFREISPRMLRDGGESGLLVREREDCVGSVWTPRGSERGRKTSEHKCFNSLLKVNTEKPSSVKTDL